MITHFGQVSERGSRPAGALSLAATMAAPAAALAMMTLSFCARDYQQCGGDKWNGRRCCAGALCIEKDEFYSQEAGCSRQQLDSATAKASATEHTKEAPSTTAARKPAPKAMRKPAAKKPSRTSLTSRVPCSGSVSLHDEGAESASRETAASHAVAVDLQKVSAWANRTHRTAPLMDD